MMQTITIKLLPIAALKPHEEINETYLEELFEEIKKDKVIKTPIIVDKKTNVILDGHHRFTIAKKLNLVTIPAIIVDYLDDILISVIPRRSDTHVTKALVIEAGISGKLFPEKTTKHILHASYEMKPFSLSALTKND